MRQPVGVKQAEEAPPVASQRKPEPSVDGYEARTRGESRRSNGDHRDPSWANHPDDHSGSYARNDYPQPVYRNDRVARPREYGSGEIDGYEGSSISMSSHPLFSGLLQELPDRSAPPSKEWLDRWSATARSILDLLYSRDSLV